MPARHFSAGARSRCTASDVPSSTDTHPAVLTPAHVLAVLALQPCEQLVRAGREINDVLEAVPELIAQAGYRFGGVRLPAPDETYGLTLPFPCRTFAHPHRRSGRRHGARRARVGREVQSGGGSHGPAPTREKSDRYRVRRSRFAEAREQERPPIVRSQRVVHPFHGLGHISSTGPCPFIPHPAHPVGPPLAGNFPDMPARRQETSGAAAPFSCTWRVCVDT